MQSRTGAYWAVTGLFAVALGGSGLAHLLRVESLVESMTALGYPVYVMSILGVAKLAGVAALLAPGRPLLKEWAYAGFTFHLLGATASHAFAGDPIREILPPALLLLLCTASYALRPQARRLTLGALAPQGGVS